MIVASIDRRRGRSRVSTCVGRPVYSRNRSALVRIYIVAWNTTPSARCVDGGLEDPIGRVNLEARTIWRSHDRESHGRYGAPDNIVLTLSARWPSPSSPDEVLIRSDAIRNTSTLPSGKLHSRKGAGRNLSVASKRVDCSRASRSRQTRREPNASLGSEGRKQQAARNDSWQGLTKSISNAPSEAGLEVCHVKKPRGIYRIITASREKASQPT